ncbi:MAG TPA: 2OG-Fe(II) oxygenase family protein [Terricaulis sp.]|nr:2OG-Fe(II) oxygenase family protein [Terricaulis sp.]
MVFDGWMTLLRLNPSIDVDAYARIYAQHKIVQIPDVFEPASAEALEVAMRTMPWRMVYQNEKRENILTTPAEFAAMPLLQRQAIIDGMRRRTARGEFGFTYLVYPMINARIANWDPGHPIHRLTDFLNGPEFLSLARRLIQFPALTKVDGQVSCYRPGDYLSYHRDEGLKSERRAAYTLGFSRAWRPDWGGLLVFHDDNNNVRTGLTPRFNTLTVFDGMMPHSVTQVASFTPNPRFSVAGWFRDDPPGEF